MFKFNLPNDLNKFFEILKFVNYKPVVIGSFADYFLLEQNKTTLKDLDLAVNSYDDLECDLSIFLDTKSTLYEQVLFTRGINCYAVEIFKNSTFDFKKESFKLQNHNFLICTPTHRLNYLKKIYTNITGYKKDLNKISNLIEQYSTKYNLD